MGGAVGQARRLLNAAAAELHEIALGGSAVGTGMNTVPGYRDAAIGHLAKQTGLPLRAAEDMVQRFQSHLPLNAYSGALRNLAYELIRIANDLRLLCSGPQTGFGEIVLPAVQPGSSIMPGKVNPVMAECLDMVCFKVVGNDLCASLAVQAGQMELNVMMPAMAQAVTESQDLLINYLPQFAKACVDGIVADAEVCRGYYEASPSLATVLNPVIGYMKAAEVAKESVKTGVPVRELVVKKGILPKAEADRLLDPAVLTVPPDRRPAASRPAAAKPAKAAKKPKAAVKPKR